MATCVSTVYILNTQPALCVEKNERHLTTKGYKVQKKKPISLSDQGFYDGSYQKLFPENYTPYSKQQPQNILNQSSITDDDIFGKGFKKEPTIDNIPALNNDEKNQAKTLTKQEETSIIASKHVEQKKDTIDNTEKKISSTRSENKATDKDAKKELPQKTNPSESAPLNDKKIEPQENNSSEKIKRLEKRLEGLEQKLLERNIHNSTMTTEDLKEKKTTPDHDNNVGSNHKSEEPRVENKRDQTKKMYNENEVIENHSAIQDQLLSFIYVQGTERPQIIEYRHKDSKHSFNMNTVEAKKIFSGITTVEQSLQNHPKDASGTFTHNPLLTTYQDIQKINSPTSTQETLCIFRNGPYFITFDYKNPQKKNPSLNAEEIYVYNQLFDKSFSKKSYFVQSIKKENNEKVYLGKIIDTGTTVIPGDTICLTQDVLFFTSEDFIKNSTIGTMEIPSDTRPSQNNSKPTPAKIPTQEPLIVAAPTAISTTAQKQIISSPKNNFSAQPTVVEDNNKPTNQNIPITTNIPQMDQKKISLPQSNNTPSPKIDAPSALLSNTPQNNTSVLSQTTNSPTSKSSKYYIRI